MNIFIFGVGRNLLEANVRENGSDAFPLVLSIFLFTLDNVQSTREQISYAICAHDTIRSNSHKLNYRKRNDESKKMNSKINKLFILIFFFVVVLWRKWQRRLAIA